MFVVSQPKTKIQEEYDFTFSNGMFLPLTLDRSLGDTVDFDSVPGAVRIIIADHPSPLNPDNKVLGEEITIFTPHLLTVHKRLREITEITQEHRDMFKLTRQELPSSKTIQ